MNKSKGRPLYQRVRRRALLGFTKAYEETLDAVQGIRTYAPLPGVLPNPEDRNQYYEAVSYLGLGAIRRRVALRPEDVVYDLGCGMGRVTCFFARQPIRGSVGVELDGGLAGIARRNAEALRGRRAPITIKEGDATEHAYGDGTVFFLFNPFSPVVLRPVLDRIHRDKADRPLRFIYVNPVHGAVMDETPWLKRIDAFSIPQHYIRVDVGVWESREGPGPT